MGPGLRACGRSAGRGETPPPFQFSGPKLPSHLWSRIVQLFYYLRDPANEVTNACSEVKVLLLLDLDTQTYRVAVPKQQVLGGSVDAEHDDLRCLVTGQKIERKPNEVVVGDWHSHNGMKAFWSGTDNDDQEKNWGVYVVLGGLEHGQPFEWKARLTRRRQVVDLKWSDVCEGDYDLSVDYSTDVHQQITQKKSEQRLLGFPGWGYVTTLCREAKCYQAHLPNSAYCEAHLSEAKPLCLEERCIIDALPNSLFCEKHQSFTQKETRPRFDQDVRDSSMDTATQELLAGVAELVDEFLDTWEENELDEVTANALMAILLSRGAKL